MQPQNLEPLKIILVGSPERLRIGIFSLFYTAPSVVVLGQVGSLGDGEAHHPEAGDQDRADRQQPVVRLGQIGHRQTQQKADQQTNHEPGHAADEFAGGQLADVADEPLGRCHGHVGKNAEADDEPRARLPAAAGTSYEDCMR